MKGRKTGGRRVGSLNKTTLAVQESILAAYDGVGGQRALCEWAEANPTAFYRMWAKLLAAETRYYMGDLSSMTDEKLDAVASGRLP